jgi:hypothetical protein
MQLVLAYLIGLAVRALFIGSGSGSGLGLGPVAVFAAPLQLQLQQRTNSTITTVNAKTIPNEDFYDPQVLGGSMLNKATLLAGEPLNVIISGSSSPQVLTKDGIVNYARAIGL